MCNAKKGTFLVEKILSKIFSKKHGEDKKSFLLVTGTFNPVNHTLQFF